MRALLHVLLLAGILIGLASHGAALAAEPCPMMDQARHAPMAGMDDCCPEEQVPDNGGVPCAEMTLACFAMTGCAALAALDADAASSIRDRGALQFGGMTAALRGLTIPPDTHSPARLG